MQEALENADIAEFLTPDAEVLQLLSDLQSRYTAIDIVSGSNHRTAMAKLEKLQIPTALFTNVITSDDGSKSDLSSYKEWLAQHPNHSVEQFLYIGDRVSSEYEKPKELGIASILVNVREYDDAVPCPQLSSIRDLREILL